ncbi:class F sortase [Streptomyces alkaliterrae]|uniref:Class F sortase n=1 Tax=Streptomyces alkaliterrae TaxID=2213162 RepID=A0A5P0YMP7_9ACTN|nr:class F sortase [Streptomyces alkaliterrae]MBB1252719.1 class F sortase [Streptomyces alkaliterrae]MBB1259512.1 class F sortase [Streptomyces alkaliterrae]MQS00947.1 class F sortase [Streptomyces alkaliterrae]
MTATAWVVLLFALWLWGKDVTEFDHGRPALGGTTSAERGADTAPELPDALAPLSGDAPPVGVRVDALGIRAEVVERGLDADGAVDAPPLSQGQLAGWYGGGATPGAAGVALLVGHVDTETEPAVFYNLSSARPGTVVEVSREDGSVAEFTVETVEVLQREGFDPERAYGPRREGRAELRLITCGGQFDRERRGYTANVVVSAYLTGTRV